MLAKVGIVGLRVFDKRCRVDRTGIIEKPGRMSYD